MTDEASDIRSIWNGDPTAAQEVMAVIVAAPTVEALYAASAAYALASFERMEAELEDRLDGMGPMGARLQADMRPSLMERMLDGVENTVDWLKGKGLSKLGNRDTDLAEDDTAPLAFGLVLLETHPTQDLSFDYEEMDAETQRMRDTFGALITADRGYAPQVPTLPDTAFALSEDEDWSDDQAVLWEVANITAYWPPSEGKPALAIAESQEDGGLPVTITLMGHSNEGHAAFTALIQNAGGRLS